MKRTTLIPRFWNIIQKKVFFLIITLACSGKRVMADSEPGNNVKVGAESFNLNDNISGTVDIYGGDPSDWYTFTVPRDGSISVHVSYSVSTGNSMGISITDMVDINRYHNFIYNSGGSVTTQTINIGKLGAGTYFVRMWNNYSGTGGLFHYNFTIITDSVSEANDAEPNNSKGAAVFTSLNDINEGHIGFISDTYVADSYDYYRVRTTKVGDFNVQINFNVSAFDNFGISGVLELLDSATSFQYAVTPFASANVILNYANLQPGTYYLWLRQSGGGCGYTMRKKLTPLLGNITFTCNSAVLYTGPPAATDNPVKICADGSNVTRVKLQTSITNDIQFRLLDENGQVNPDIARYGFFGMPTALGNTVEAVFTHPTYMELNQLYRPCTLQVLHNGIPLSNINFPIRLYRAPIVFVHGLMGSEATFSNVKSRLINEELYVSPLMYSVNYQLSSLLSLQANRTVVRAGIDRALSSARLNKFSAGKPIVIGHSMGGILARLYLQNKFPGINYREDIGKLITLNTPHYGTQLANILLTDITWAEIFLSLYLGGNPVQLLGITDPLLGAVKDLSVNSQPVMHELNNNTSPQNITPSVTLSTDQQGDHSAIAKALRVLLYYHIQIRDIFQGDRHDLVVPLVSQRSTLTSSPVINEQWHAGSASNTGIYEQIKNIINADPAGSVFSHSGFPSGTLAPPNPLIPLWNALGNATSSDSLKIIYPLSGQHYLPNDTVTMQIFSSNSINHMALLGYGASIDPVSIDTGTVTILRFKVPENAAGEIKLALLGGNAANWLQKDTMHIVVDASGYADSILNVPEKLDIPLGLQGTVSLKGYFNYASTAVDITMAPGVTALFDPAFLAHTGQGNFKGIRTGSTKIVYLYQGKYDTTLVSIINDSSVLAASFNISQSAICPSDTILFRDQSTGLVLSYQWSFPGGYPSSSVQKDPLVTYSSLGVYPASLKTVFANGVDSLVLDSVIYVQYPVYTFTGNGNWNEPANWSNNRMPPPVLIKCSEIVVNPVAGGACYLNVPQTIMTGAKLTIEQGAKFIVMGHLTLR